MGKNLAYLAAGVVLGYFTAKVSLETKLDRKYAARAEAEIAAAQEYKRSEKMFSVSEMFGKPDPDKEIDWEKVSQTMSEAPVKVEDSADNSDRVIKPSEAFSIAQEAVDELVSPDNPVHQRIDDILDRAATAFTDYSAISTGGKSTGSQKAEEPPKEEAMAEVFVELISQLEFEMNEPEHDQTTFVYHAVDGILTNDSDTPMDIKKAFGVMDQTWFGKKSDDPNTCHLRNNEKQIDFEVVRSPGSYRKDVLGQSDDE
jgi:hypothetical protein